MLYASLYLLFKNKSYLVSCIKSLTEMVYKSFFEFIFWVKPKLAVFKKEHLSTSQRGNIRH